MKRIVLLISLYTLAYNSGCTTKKKETEEPGKYTVTSALRVDTSFIKEYVSQIQSIRNVEIRAQEKGYLESINVDEGRYVHAGQVLFKIVPTMYQAEYLKAEAAVKGAELEMLNAKTLADKDIVSKSEQAIAQAKLDEAKADMALAKLHLSLTEIKAPFDGVIDRIPLKLGSLIDEGALLTTLSDNKSVYAYFNVPEKEYLDYKALGDTSNMKSVSLLLANNETHKYKGVVETVEGQFDNETGNIAFRAKFPNTQLLLKHGETGKVQMTIPLKDALVIPQKATYELQDKVYVFVVDKNNVVKSRNITIKNRLSDIYVIDGGLSEGDKILLEGVQNVKDDDKIEYKYVEPAAVISSLQLIKQ
ncbi:efflux RND transporter periplasmic adaptor subunit [Ferruginibacter sp. SUN106]|uniref:efflux RND transporter periplasmic adaptor subunit n=1 Tax=Ferruginibacter sp. SUN106 TaxID=2978348 RepID=UPI003D369C72